MPNRLIKKPRQDGKQDTGRSGQNAQRVARKKGKLFGIEYGETSGNTSRSPLRP